MASVNKVILLGNAGKDAELRYTANGAAVCGVSIATTRAWKNKDSGERQEETEWHRVVFYDKLAEIAGEYVKKGRTVYIEGRLKTRKYTDKDGIEKYTTEIIGNEMVLVGRADDAPKDAPKQQPRSGPPAKTARSGPPTGQGKSATAFDDMESDIPF